MNAARSAVWPAGRWQRLLPALALALGPALLPASQAAGLAPLSGATGALPPAPWAFAGLPDQRFPPTRFQLDAVEGGSALRVEAVGAYGNLVHPLAAVPAGELAWRWRVDRRLPGADLRTKQGDDTSLKVCAMFDLPRSRVPFIERQLLRLAESRVGQPLPNATLCYVWDPAWPRDTVLPNAYTRRVRYITLGAAEPGWQRERRTLAADFLRAFGDESPTVPALIAIAVGADSDNTGGHSLGWVGDLRLDPAPPRAP
jgi:hypothetical protein